MVAVEVEFEPGNTTDDRVEVVPDDVWPGSEAWRDVGGGTGGLERDDRERGSPGTVSRCSPAVGAGMEGTAQPAVSAEGVEAGGKVVVEFESGDMV